MISKQTPAKETYKQHCIIGGEKLYQVKQQEMSELLHRNIVAIIWRSEGSTGRSSGLLISRDLLITTASGLHYFKKRVSDDKIEIYHAPCGPLKESYKVQQSYIPPQYQSSVKSISISFDYALLKLTEKVQSDGFLQFEEGFSETADPLAIFGYPASSFRLLSQLTNQEAVSQFGLIKKNAVLKINQQKRQIAYDISTQAGQSGSPILHIRDGNQISVIGIHKGSIRMRSKQYIQQYNCGCLITAEIIAILKKEALTMGAEPFKVYKKRETINNTQQNYVHYGDSQLSKKNYHQAIEWYRLALKNSPNQASVHRKLGECLKEINKYQQARQCYLKSLSLEPKNHSAYNNLGNILRELNKLEEAVEYYRKALQLNPGYSKAYYNLGRVLAGTNKVEQAIECYKKAISLDPNYSQAYNNLGLAYRLIKDTKLEIECYRKALQLSKKDPEICFNLGVALLYSKQYQEAFIYLKKYQQQSPKKADIQYYLAQASHNVQKSQQQQLSKKVNKGDDSPTFIGKGKI